MRFAELQLSEDGVKHRDTMLNNFTGRLISRSVPVYIPSVRRSVVPPSWWNDEQDLPIILAPPR